MEDFLEKIRAKVEAGPDVDLGPDRPTSGQVNYRVAETCSGCGHFWQQLADTRYSGNCDLLGITVKVWEVCDEIKEAGRDGKERP
jgi:hypothetical protein